MKITQSAAVAKAMPPRSGATRRTLDGRMVRRHGNRRRIVEAMLELVGGGAISPDAEQIARHQ